MDFHFYKIYSFPLQLFLLPSLPGTKFLSKKPVQLFLNGTMLLTSFLYTSPSAPKLLHLQNLQLYILALSVAGTT